MNNNKKIIKKLKDFIKELEKEYDVPPFADITRRELDEVLCKYRNGELDLKDYWKPGDKKVTEDGCEYVILDIGYDELINGLPRTVTLMRTDLINLEVSLRSKDGSYGNIDFSDTQLYQEFKRRPDYYVGWFFYDNEYNLDTVKDGLECDVFLLSEEEIFDEEKAYEYFKSLKNRKLGNSWWSRSGFLFSSGDAGFVYCGSDGSQYGYYPTVSRGLAPCFVI